MFVFQFHYVETVLSFRMIEEGPKLMKVCFDFCKQILNKGKVPSPQNLRFVYGGGGGVSLPLHFFSNIPTGPRIQKKNIFGTLKITIYKCSSCLMFDIKYNGDIAHIPI